MMTETRSPAGPSSSGRGLRPVPDQPEHKPDRAMSHSGCHSHSEKEEATSEWEARKCSRKRGTEENSPLL